jgi:IclR family acetate operon transcriptional repressor
MTEQTAVKTAARTLDVLEVFAKSKGPLTLTELAQRTGSPMSSCHALVRTLQARGYVYVLDERKRVYPTKRLLMVAQQIAENDAILERITPVLATLRQKTDETVILGKRQGKAVTYLEVLEGGQTIRYAASPGDTKPLHSSAIGKATLGAMPDTDLHVLLRKLAFPKITGTTIVDQAALVADIESSRARGYFVTRGENVAEVMAISIARQIGDELYGLAIAGPMSRIEARSESLVKELLKSGTWMEGIDAELRGAP